MEQSYLSDIYADFLTKLKNRGMYNSKDWPSLELIQLAKNGDENSRNEIWEGCLLYIVKNLQKHHKLFRQSYSSFAQSEGLDPLMTLDDAIALSWESLGKALDSYDPTKGKRKFQTWFLKRLELDIFVICRRELSKRQLFKYVDEEFLEGIACG